MFPHNLVEISYIWTRKNATILEWGFKVVLSLKIKIGDESLKRRNLDTTLLLDSIRRAGNSSLFRNVVHMLPMK